MTAKSGRPEALPVVIVLMAWLCCASAWGQPASRPGWLEPATPPADASAAPQTGNDECRPCLAERETLTNDWFGQGEKLSEQGVEVCLALTQVYQHNFHGGLNTQRGNGRYNGRYDLETNLDLEKLARLPGGRFYTLLEGGWSDGIDPASVGSLFGANYSAVGDEPAYIWEMYYEQSALEDKLFARIGKVDLHGGFECRGCPGSFDGNSYAGDDTSQFLNTALNINPAIPIPDAGLGVILHAEPAEWWYVSSAVADAQADFRETGFNTAFHGPDDFFSICETGFLPRLASSKGPLQGAYRFGTWYDPQPKDAFDGDGVTRDDVGAYTSCDQMIWKENADAEDCQGAGLFFRYGFADADVNEIKSFWSVGAQYQGLLPSRDEDVMGFGVGQGRLSRQAGYTERHETVLEWYYNIQVTPWCQIAPDVQYILHPGADETVDDALVLGLRCQLTF